MQDSTQGSGPGVSKSSSEPQLHQLHLDAWMALGSLSVITPVCEIEAVKSMFQSCLYQLDVFKCLLAQYAKHIV